MHTVISKKRMSTEQHDQDFPFLEVSQFIIIRDNIVSRHKCRIYSNDATIPKSFFLDRSPCLMTASISVVA